MILDLYNPIIGAIYIASKIHKINYNLVKTPLRDDWNDRRLLNGLSYRVTNNAPANDFRNVIKSDSIIPLKDNFMGLCATY
jgi:hypothetical protein